MEALNLSTFLKKDLYFHASTELDQAQKEAQEILARKKYAEEFNFDMEQNGIVNHLHISRLNASQYEINEEQIYFDGDNVENKSKKNNEVTDKQTLKQMLDNLFAAKPELKEKFNAGRAEISVSELMQKAEVNFLSVSTSKDLEKAMKFKDCMAFKDPNEENSFKNFLSKSLLKRNNFPFMGNIAENDVEQHFNNGETLFNADDSNSNFELREIKTKDHKKAYILRENISQFGYEKPHYCIFNSLEAVQKAAFPIMRKVHGDKLVDECEQKIDQYLDQKFAENSFLSFKRKNELDLAVKAELQNQNTENLINEIPSEQSLQQRQEVAQEPEKQDHELDPVDKKKELQEQNNAEKLQEQDVTSLASEAKTENDLKDSFGMGSIPSSPNFDFSKDIKPLNFLKTKDPAELHFKIDESYVLAESKGASPESEALLKNKSFHTFNLGPKRTVYGMTKSVLHALPKILTDTGVVFFKGLKEAMMGKEMKDLEKYKFAELKPEQKLQEQNSNTSQQKQDQGFHL